MSIPLLLLVFSPNAAARRHCSPLADIVLPNACVEHEPASVQQFCCQLLLWPSSLLRFEEHLLPESCNLLKERLASDALGELTARRFRHEGHQRCETSHFKTDLARLAVASIYLSVNTWKGGIWPRMLWLARTMRPLELLSPMERSSCTISVRM